MHLESLDARAAEFSECDRDRGVLAYLAALLALTLTA